VDEPVRLSCFSGIGEGGYMGRRNRGVVRDCALAELYTRNIDSRWLGTGDG
jgi:hypothetical protein